MSNGRSLDNLTPAGGVLAIIAGILIAIMVPPTIPSTAPAIEYWIIYGFSAILIIAGIAAIYKAVS
jgi:hypothetical protein